MNSDDGILRFGEFTLDPANRRLTRGDHPVELGGRYFDALVMLARAPGELVSKDRLHAEVWRGVPVTDEALSQAIKTLRRTLGDDAASPRFIETVPRHGYRFIAATGGNSAPAHPSPTAKSSESSSPVVAPHDGATRLVTGGMAGAALAAVVVGLAYGGLASRSGAGGAFSLVIVLVSVCVLSALVAGFGIAAGITLATHRAPDASKWWRAILGGAAGGWMVGGIARLLGIDALRLLTGTAPERIAGAAEGVVAGVAVGIGLLLARRLHAPSALLATACLGAAVGIAIVALGGTLMAGSLASLVRGFPGAALSLSWAASPPALLLSGAFEGAAFVTGVVAGLTAAASRTVR